jgi:hypothetical protein
LPKARYDLSVFASVLIISNLFSLVSYSTLCSICFSAVLKLIYIWICLMMPNLLVIYYILISIRYVLTFLLLYFSRGSLYIPPPVHIYIYIYEPMTLR